MYNIIHAVQVYLLKCMSLYILDQGFMLVSFPLHQVHEPSIPADLLQTQSGSTLEFTSLSYGSHPTLFTATNNGRNMHLHVATCMCECPDCIPDRPVCVQDYPKSIVHIIG